MNSRPPLTDADGEVRELTAADMRSFRPAHEVLPESLQKTLGIRTRGPQHTPTKTPISARFDAEIVERFRATGSGWQTRMNAALKDWLKTHDPRDVA